MLCTWFSVFLCLPFEEPSALTGKGAKMLNGGGMRGEHSHPCIQHPHILTLTHSHTYTHCAVMRRNSLAKAETLVRQENLFHFIVQDAQVKAKVKVKGCTS